MIPMIGPFFRSLPGSVFSSQVCGREREEYIVVIFFTVARVCCETVASEFHRRLCIYDVSLKVAEACTDTTISITQNNTQYVNCVTEFPEQSSSSSSSLGFTALNPIPC